MTDPRNQVGLETPEVDAAEQATVAVPGWQDDNWTAGATSVEANEWDAQEQNRIVEFDDDYR